MRTVSLFTILVALALGSFVSLNAAEHSPLEEAMESMNKAYKALKITVGDASKNADNLKHVDAMQNATLLAKGMVPARAAKLSGAEKEKFIAGYRKAMIGLMSEYLKLEAALVDGKNDQAAEIYKGLIKLKNDGHENFQEQ